jgi:peptidoglycan/LPS O-acetylase OafA/YrhL
MEKERSRVGKLDSVRGIAALMVVIGHCGRLSLFGSETHLGFWWLPALWDGHSAVIGFFLLSGYVLALQLDAPNRPTYWAYLVRRFFRIWPAFAAAVVLAFLALRWSSTPVDFDPHGGLPATPTNGNLLENLFMVGSPFTVDPPVWSLYVEARLSIIFPFLLLFTRRLGMLWAILISTAATIPITRLVHWDLPEVVLSMVKASRYIVLFIIGAALAAPQNPVAIVYRCLSKHVKALLLIFALACLVAKFYSTQQPLPFMGYVSWAGVCVLFVFCLYSKLAERLLDRAPFRFLGRVSYGLYLVHFPIILILKDQISGGWFTVVVVALSVLVAGIINCWVEQPSVALGRKITRSRLNTTTGSCLS